MSKTVVTSPQQSMSKTLTTPPKPTNIQLDSDASPVRSPSPVKAAPLPGPKQEPLSLVSLVNLKDQMTSDQVIEYFKKLVDFQSQIGGICDDIGAVFDKIQAWKKKFGNLDEQEKAVSQALKNSKNKV